MRKIKTVLNQDQMERLIYNDLDPLQGYPDYLAGTEDEDTLKERIEQLRLPGEKLTVLGGEYTKTYAISNYGRMISGKRVPQLVVYFNNERKEHYMFLHGKRKYLRQIMEDNNYTYDYDKVQEIGIKNRFKLSEPYGK